MTLFKSAKGAFDVSNPDTVFGHESYFQGTLTAKGSLKIDGRIDGSIVDAKMVTVGKTGKVKGDISCETCVVCGEVRGNVLALGHIEVFSGGRIDGDICSPRLVLEEGAVFNGNCSMEPAAAEPGPAPARAEKTEPQKQEKDKTEKHARN